jgi:hypothetical protein
MIEYRPQVAASTRIAKCDPRPRAETHPKPHFDAVAYAAALEILG